MASALTGCQSTKSNTQQTLPVALAKDFPSLVAACEEFVTSGSANFGKLREAGFTQTESGHLFEKQLAAANSNTNANGLTSSVRFTKSGSAPNTCSITHTNQRSKMMELHHSIDLEIEKYGFEIKRKLHAATPPRTIYLKDGKAYQSVKRYKRAAGNNWRGDFEFSRLPGYEKILAANSDIDPSAVIEPDPVDPNAAAQAQARARAENTRIAQQQHNRLVQQQQASQQQFINQVRSRRP